MNETTAHIFNEGTKDEELVLSIFRHQYKENKVYHDWVNALNILPQNVTKTMDIPFLPISFFKTNKVVSGHFEPELIFESSGTTQTINSRHWVKDAALYTQSFTKAFKQFYGSIRDYCVIGLLPSYLERKNSSLVQMVDEMIVISQHPDSGFYLYDFEKLAQVLKKLNEQKQPVLLIGVTFALLDFAEEFPMQLHHTIVMETGGMKGRREELTRTQVHDSLKEKLGLFVVHSEYGMTELLSQAYSKGNGLYQCPVWMKALVRDENDPLQSNYSGKGILNIIDLANIHSCSFIATDDVGIVHEDSSFEVWGRLDNSDIRGCSLLVV